MSDMEAHIERVYEKYPKDNDIWLLLQDLIYVKREVQELKNQVEQLNNQFGIEKMRMERENGESKAN